MKVIFLDTNILIDYLDRREGYESARCLLAQKNQGLKLLASVLTMVNITYVRRKTVSIGIAYEEFERLQGVVDIVGMSNGVYLESLRARWKDFEDALQYFSSIEAGAECIITRNTKDFTASQIPVMTPEEFLSTYVE